MKFTTAALLCTVALIIGLVRVEGRCNQPCTRELNPVCGIIRHSRGQVVRCTFPTLCVFNVYKCRVNEPWNALPGACSQDSPNCGALLRRNPK